MDGYDVLPDELSSHAGKVEALAGRLSTAVDAANTVTMDNSAYGVVCQPFALMLQPFEEMGVRALQLAAEAVTDTAMKIQQTVKSYQTTDGAEAASFRGVEGEL